jgi:hypothetical protein
MLARAEFDTHIINNVSRLVNNELAHIDIAELSGRIWVLGEEMVTIALRVVVTRLFSRYNGAAINDILQLALLPSIEKVHVPHAVASIRQHIGAALVIVHTDN